MARLDRIEHLSDDEVRIVRLAALIHDVGHGPFSHVSEYLLDQHYDWKKLGKVPTREKIHEKVTVDIIRTWPELDGVMSACDRNEVAEIIEGTRSRDYRRDIVSSSLDADKIDYLSRDALFAGVKYGTFDLDKVVEACRKHTSGQETYLVVDEEGLFAVEQLVVAKYHMTQQVYAHRVRTVTDLMIVRGLELAIEDGVSEVERLYKYDGSKKFLQRYLLYDDVRLMGLMLDARRSRGN